MVVEGILLARYRYDALKAAPTVTPITSLNLVVEGRRSAATRRGVAKGKAMAEATQVARDLANTPPANLTAARMAEVATRLGRSARPGDRGLRQGPTHRDGLWRPARRERREQRASPNDQADLLPGQARGHLTLVGKGIMYDAGGIAIKPGDAVHATMKNDMSGAGAILAAMSRAAGARLQDRSHRLPDVHRQRSLGDSDRDGRGAHDLRRQRPSRWTTPTPRDGWSWPTPWCWPPRSRPTPSSTSPPSPAPRCGPSEPRSRGSSAITADVIDQVEAAAAATGESVWELPLERRYRGQLNSDVADMKNLGGPNAGAITAALFLEEFVDGMPWAHIDIAGTAQNDRDTSWRPPGCTGFGARLLIELALELHPAPSLKGARSGAWPRPWNRTGRRASPSGCWTVWRRMGNKVPHPVMMFLYLIIFIIVLSAHPRLGRRQRHRGDRGPGAQRGQK